MDGLQVDTRKQPDLEVVTQSQQSAPKQDYSKYLLVTKDEAPPYHETAQQQPPSSPTTSSRDSRICGLKRKTFFIVLAVVLLLVIGGAVGGGVGGSLASKKSNDGNANAASTTPTPTSAIASGTGTSTSSSASGTGTLSVTGDTVTPGVYRIRNVMGGTAVDLLYGSTDNGTAISGWEMDLNAAKGTYDHQAWQISLLSKGLVTIVNAFAGSYIVAPKGIDPVNNPPTANLSLAAVYGTQLSSTTDKYAQWKVTTYSDDSVSFSNVAYPEKMLDLAYGNSTNGVYITVWQGGAGPNQRWKLIPS